MKYFKCIDNVVSKRYQDEIEHVLLGLRFSWRYLEEVSYFTKEHIDEHEGEPTPGFANVQYDRQVGIEGEFLDYLMPLFYEASEKFEEPLDNLLRIKCGLLVKTGKTTYNKAHIDYNIPHKTLLYYVNDSDGDTIFFDYNSDGNRIPVDRCSPKKGRIILFGGGIYHSSSCPQQHQKRVVINANFVPKYYEEN
jgi:hypothetical protein